MADAGLTRGGFYTYFESKSDHYAEALAFSSFTDPSRNNTWEGVDIDLTAAQIGPQMCSRLSVWALCVGGAVAASALADQPAPERKPITVRRKARSSSGY
jgi:hypothetical protein